MFTGLIERVGRLAARRQVAGGAALAVSHDPWETPLEIGESVAVQGACLTVTGAHEDGFNCDVLDETLARSNLGEASTGDLLNLERAMRLGDRIGGHLVSGHLDGTGRVVRVARAGRDWVLSVDCGGALASGIVLKGSIAVDGVSLTLAAVSSSGFDVHIIPHTWHHTSLQALCPGRAVNLELDMIGKFVQRYMDTRTGAGSVSEDTLRQAGFIC